MKYSKREVAKMYTHERDHKAQAFRKFSGNLGGGYFCKQCDELLERSGNGFRHRAKFVG